MTDSPSASPQLSLVDTHGRVIRYLRVSVTDRCDLRCRYCMSEQMKFLPRHALLDFEEIVAIAERFVTRGVNRIRLTGGEPLARRGVGGLIRRLGALIGRGLDELTLTTNGTNLAAHAAELYVAGVRRVNVSMDTLEPDRFRFITRHGDLTKVMNGIDAAKAVGLAIKINAVALAGLNEDDIPSLLDWCISEGHDLSLIETMPLGMIDEDRTDRFVPLTRVFERLSQRFELVRDMHRTGGPARYWRIAGTASRLGLISPLTANFCDGCNRMRLTTEGRLYACLGHDKEADLKTALRAGGIEALDEAIDTALAIKPARHEFVIGPGERPAVSRHMSVTGG